MFKLISSEKLIVGIDISDEYTQISYCGQDSADNVETLSLTAGDDNFNIPTVLCKREGVNQWLFGRDALKLHATEGGILLKNLLSLAADGENVMVEGVGIEPVSLLTLFLKRCLGLLAQMQPSERIVGLMMTCRHPNPKTTTALTEAARGLNLKTDRIFVQGYDESFYSYILHQPEDVWKTGALLMDYCDGMISTSYLKSNRRTTPVVVHIDEEESLFAAYRPIDAENDTDIPIPSELSRMDREFLKICENSCEDRTVSGVYLIGEEFSDQWMKESLKYLCRGRRVFQGSNLYSKGACYGMLQRIKRDDAQKTYVFMGKDKLKSNIGMKFAEHNGETYCAVLDAGVNWYEAERTLDFYIQGGNMVEIYISSLVGRGNKLAQIVLEELPEGLSRLHAAFSLTDASHMKVEIEDMGLGAMRAATHHVWKEEIEV
jgi:hypothetical protein